MTLVLTSLGVAVVSALVPLVNVELYLAGVGAIGRGQLAAIAVATGVGQTLGKIVWYEGARFGIDSAWMRRKLSGPKIEPAYERWVKRIDGRPWYAAAVLFLAGSLGAPPMLVMAAVAGALKVPRWVFIPTVLISRTLRFGAILAGAAWVFVE